MARPHWWDRPLESLTHQVITWDMKDHESKSLNQGVAHWLKRAFSSCDLLRSQRSRLTWVDKTQTPKMKRNQWGTLRRITSTGLSCASWRRKVTVSGCLGKRRTPYMNATSSLYRFMKSRSHLEPCDLNKSHDRGRGRVSGRLHTSAHVTLNSSHHRVVQWLTTPPAL